MKELQEKKKLEKQQKQQITNEQKEADTKQLEKNKNEKIVIDNLEQPNKLVNQPNKIVNSPKKISITNDKKDDLANKPYEKAFIW